MFPMLNSSILAEHGSTKKKEKLEAALNSSGPKTALVIGFLLLLIPDGTSAQITFEEVNQTAAFSVMRDASGDLLVGLNGGLARSSDDGASLASLVLTYPDGRAVTELIGLGNGDMYAVSFLGDVDF